MDIEVCRDVRLLAEGQLSNDCELYSCHICISYPIYYEGDTATPYWILYRKKP